MFYFLTEIHSCLKLITLNNLHSLQALIVLVFLLLIALCQFVIMNLAIAARYFVMLRCPILSTPNAQQLLCWAFGVECFMLVRQLVLVINFTTATRSHVYPSTHVYLRKFIIFIGFNRDRAFIELLWYKL